MSDSDKQSLADLYEILIILIINNLKEVHQIF